ncbi:MAG: hypothetical protein HY754_13045 [Nitrospirae bacterium]|nr:hypothetical protein [Nitrospirota bacterium]
MLVAYLHKDGLEVYRTTENKVEKYASGTPEQLKPIKSFGKKLMIVGRDLFLHIRKRYPPASEKDLKKAVLNEIEEMFPIKNPSYFSKVFEKAEAYTLVDIWAWDNSGINGAKAVFPFTHIMPEDAAFISDEPEASILMNNGIASVVAYARDGFIGSVSAREHITSQQFDVFLKSLGRYSNRIKRVIVYNEPYSKIVDDLSDFSLEVLNKQPKAYPVCIDYTGKLDLKDFRIASGYDTQKNIHIVMRGIIYLLIAVSISLGITARNYDASLKEINKKISRVVNNAASLTSKTTGEDYRDIEDELNENLKGNMHPLKVMDMLARYLPEKSYVNRVALNEGRIELTLSSKEPLNVIKAIGQSEMISTVKLKGAPAKDQFSGSYTFTVVAELK